MDQNYWGFSGTMASIDMLTITIRDFNSAAEKQTQVMVRLTWAIALMTAVMTVGVCVQIWLVL
jgi:hypothetical protein